MTASAQDGCAHIKQLKVDIMLAKEQQSKITVSDLAAAEAAVSVSS